MADILVIEDDPQISLLLQRILQSHGHSVRTATDGIAGVRMFRAAPAALVITDVYMPGQDGIETTIKLRDEFPDVKILVISGGSRDAALQALEDAQLLGAARALAKPFTAPALIAAVDELLLPP